MHVPKQVLKTDLVTAQHSAGLIDQVLDKLATARLVVVDVLGSRGDKKPLVTVIDVAHEALIRHWGKLRRWLSENRNALTKKREIETAAKDWEDHGKSKDYLLQGPKLGMAEDYVNNDADKVPLLNLAQEFVQVSKIERDRSVKEEEERIQREKEQAQIFLLKNYVPNLFLLPSFLVLVMAIMNRLYYWLSKLLRKKTLEPAVVIYCGYYKLKNSENFFYTALIIFFVAWLSVLMAIHSRRGVGIIL